MPIALILIGALVLLTHCAKTNPVSPDQPHSPVDTAVVDAAGGVLFVQTEDSLVKIDVEKGNTLWRMPVYSVAGTSGSPLDYDSGMLFQGSYTNLAAYESQTGAVRWHLDFLKFSDAAAYRAVAFTDSLIYVTSPTDRFQGLGELFCLNRISGTVRWSTRIDSNQYDLTHFNGIPLVVDSSVICLGTDVNGTYHLVCYDAVSGRQRWVSSADNRLSAHIHVAGDKIFAADGQFAVCYRLTDGLLAWASDLQLEPSAPTFMFPDGNTVIIVRNDGAALNHVKLLNAANGVVLKGFDVPVPGAVALGCIGFVYRPGIIYMVNSLADSVQLTAVNTATATNSWEYRFKFESATVPILTDRYLIFPVAMDSAGSSTRGKWMRFLDFNGKMVQQVAYDANFTNRFLYLDHGVLYKPKDY